MALPTTRRSGLGGTAEMGSAGSVYDSADCQEWTLEATQADHDANCKGDLYDVSQLGRLSANGTIKKLVASVAFTKSSLLGTVIPLVLTTGDGSDIVGSGGDAVFTGNVIIKTVGYVSPDGMEAENLTWKSTGEFDLKDA